MPLDWESVYGLIAQRRAEVGPDAPAADTWTPALDAMLEPCRAAAASVGYLMTPVVVVDGDVRHHGSVPSLRQLEAWSAKG